ncbi:hypothetical protein B0T26DRAFT_669920 [Lasiosphaeria miniovina]|uniref:Extracellular matrix protein n=1 Tax=Lasiosphaeria miniovina TaxID=1954250 RepID=A0AA40BFX7_9PEZI|nr:uncharacterized protein B0T26DRAFT_669920 [Lasiosphaeria miniovina]KAK0733517.1 hypothetical protein B0T26DRAFT_669920 [Lasiosphaeria miniovina]
MKFSLAAAVGALATFAAARPGFTNNEIVVAEGKPTTLTWDGASAPVTITLMTGPDELSMKPFKVLDTKDSGTTFTYTPTDIPSGLYSFQITDGVSEPNYSVKFQYTSATVSASSSTSVTSSASTSSAPTSSSSTTSGSTTSTGSTSSTTGTTTGTTTTRPTTSSTATTTRSTSTSTPINNTNDSQRHSAPLALLLVAAAALMFYN